MKKYLIIYHDVDNDGLFSMAIIYHYLISVLKACKDDIELLGAEYEKLKSVNIQELCDNYEYIYLTDVSFQEFDKIKYLYDNKGDKFCWIDHHAPIIKQSINEGYNNISGIRNIEKSALLNAYQYFYDKNNINYNEKNISIELLRILSGMDSFTYEKEGYDIDYVRAVNTGVTNTFNLDPYKIIEFIIEYFSNNEVEWHKKIIKDYYNYGLSFNIVEQQQYDKLISDYGQEYSINADGRTAIALFIQGPTSSLIFRSIKDSYTNGIVFKHLKNGNWGISLYNTDIKYDQEFHCGEYLKNMYNGGGHAGAAGCQVTEDEFIKILKNKKI